MAGKTKYSRLESDIERCRVDCQWKKAGELIKQLASKSPGLDYYVHFILGESALEDYVKRNPPTEQNTVKANQELADAERHFKIVIKENGKLSLEAGLLLAKLHYCQGSYQSALTLFDNFNLDGINLKVNSPRLLHIVAEAYAIKGLCLEKTSPTTTSKYKAAEKEEKILNCFEMSGDLALLYLQEKEKASYGSLTTSAAFGPEPDESVGDILETAIQQSPIHYIKHGELEKGIKRFRDLLRAVESRFTAGLRQTLARQLAEVLLRGVCEKTYFCPDLSSSVPHKRAFNPRRYSGEKLFIPHNENEEALLLLLIAEAVATRDAVLNRTAEHTEARRYTFHNTTAVYDLMALALVKHAQFNKLSESFEKAMKFSFEEFHVWHQFANSLLCARKYNRALLVLKECYKLRPKNVIVSLQAAKLCYEHLHQNDEGITFALKALEVGENHPMASRAYVALGIGYSLKANEMKLKADRQTLHKKALDAFHRAHVLDPSDYLSLFHLALQLAVLRQIAEAVKYTRLSLKYYSEHIHSLHLMVLLLSAQKQYQEAMDLLKAALEEYPEHLSLLLTKSKLEELVQGPEKALNTCKMMLKLWKDLQGMDMEDRIVSTSKKLSTLTDVSRTAFDRRSQAQLQLNELTDRDTGSIRAESIAASRMEQNLSEVASSLNSSFHYRPGSQQSWRLQAQIWLHLGELYLCLDKIKEAESCVAETSSIFPLSHQVSYLRGRVFEHKQKYKEAKICYEDAISINPGHTKSLQHLGMVLHHLDNDKLAEKVLRDAVNTDPTSHQSWFCLGLVLESLNHSEAAANCQMTALDLEASSPVVPFTVIPRLMQ